MLFWRRGVFAGDSAASSSARPGAMARVDSGDGYQSAFSPDGRWLAAASREGTLQVWDASTGEAMTPPLPTAGTVDLCRFSPNGRWIITLEDDRIVVCRPLLLEPLSPQNAELKATLLSGYRVDDQGLLIPLDSSESARLAKLSVGR